MDENKQETTHEDLRFPIFISLAGKKVLVVGGGPIAQRRVKVLLDYGAQILLVAPQVTEELRQLGEEGAIQLEQRSYEEEDLKDSQLVLAVTDRREVNQQIGRQAKQEGIFVSVADCKEESTFYFPGTVKTSKFVAGVVSTDGDHGGVKKAVHQLKELWSEDKQ